MVLVALLLLATGVLVAFTGHKLFKIMLPLLGLVGGMMVGFSGFQAVFGKGAISTTIAIFVAFIVGLLMALLSFLFFELALILYVAILFGSLFTYLGIALGLGNSGFVMFMLSLAGFFVGLSVAGNIGFSTRFVIALTSFAGVALILASIFLIAGHISVDQLHQDGIIATVVKVVDQSFLWVFVWLGGSLLAMQVQHRVLLLDVLANKYEYQLIKENK